SDRRNLSLTGNHRLRFGTNDKGVAILFKAGSSRNQTTDDHIFFQAQQIINAPIDRGLRQDTRGFLDEAAEIKLSVVNAALVMPSRTGFPRPGCPPFANTR